MQVRDVGAAATGGLVVAGALTLPGLVRRAREVVERLREEERQTKALLDNHREYLDNLHQRGKNQQQAIDELHEDLDVLIGVVAGAVLNLDSPASAPLARLVASRTGPAATIQEIQRIFEVEREIAKAKREAKRRDEEAAAGTNLRCPECDALRPDWVEAQGKKGEPPTCPECGSNQEPKAPDA